MNLLTITAIDKHSSDTMGRTFSTDPISNLKFAIEEWESELPFHRYELVCNELMDDYPDEVAELLEELEVTF